MYFKRRVYYEFYSVSSETGKPLVGYNMRIGREVYTGVLHLSFPFSPEYFLDCYTGTFSFFTTFTYSGSASSRVGVKLYSQSEYYAHSIYPYSRHSNSHQREYPIAEGYIQFDTSQAAAEFYNGVITY